MRTSSSSFMASVSCFFFGEMRSLSWLNYIIGDSHIPFAKLGKQLNLPRTAILALRAPEQYVVLHYMRAYTHLTHTHLLQSPLPLRRRGLPMVHLLRRPRRARRAPKPCSSHRAPHDRPHAPHGGVPLATTERPPLWVCAGRERRARVRDCVVEDAEERQRPEVK